MVGTRCAIGRRMRRTHTKVTKVTKVFKSLMDRRELDLFSFETPYISFVTFVAFV